MKAGFNLLLWTTHVTDDHGHLFEKLKTAGYDGIEIPLFEGDEKHYRSLSKQIRSAGLKTTTVTVTPDANRSCLSSDKQIQQRALDYLKWAIDCSAALKSDVLCGPFYHPLADFSARGDQGGKTNCHRAQTGGGTRQGEYFRSSRSTGSSAISSTRRPTRRRW
jgi:D-psicose/D-tagatose/L-ribulose 3-epimerase